jgi:hypothetical protein
LERVIPNSGTVLPPLDCEYVTELTRALFNLSLNCGAEDTAALVAVAAQLDRLLNISIDDLASRMSVHGGVINIVTNFEAMPAVTGLLFENNMGNVKKLLDFLIYKMENAKTNLKVTTAPSYTEANCALRHLTESFQNL